MSPVISRARGCRPAATRTLRNQRLGALAKHLPRSPKRPLRYTRIPIPGASTHGRYPTAHCSPGYTGRMDECYTGLQGDRTGTPALG